MTSRKKVLNYLTKTHSASAREISRALKMSVATIRHHLRVLASDGRLEIASARRMGNRGRPEIVYSIPRAAWGDNLSALSDALWAVAGSTVSVEALAKYLAHAPGLEGQAHTKRLNLAVERLNTMNYHARWEAGAAGPRIILGHCPYAAILAGHPELCRVDAALLRELTGRKAESSARIVDGAPACVFEAMD